MEIKQDNGNTVIGGAGFYGVKNESQQDVKPPVAQKAAAPAAPNRGGPGNATIYPIEALSPYAHKWTIKARVTSKSDIRTFRNGEGKLFSVNLLDESGEIKLTGFNEQCDQFYDVLQEGSVYYFSSPCKVGFAKKQFSNLPNDYELVMEAGTVIEKSEDQTAVPQVRFNFCNIRELQDVEKDATIDIIGVLKEVGDVGTIISKTKDKPFDKRELTLVDDTGFSVRATLWGKTANSFDAKPESVVAFKGMRVGDFGGRSLSMLSSGTMTIDPDIPEAHKLKGWYDASGRNNDFATHKGLGGATGRVDQVKTIGQVRDENLGTENVDYFVLKATIVFIKQKSFAYPACRNEGCNRKVSDQPDGTWRCEKCDANHARPEYRYLMTISVSDHTGQMYLTCFDDVGRIIMGGKSADELTEMRENDEEAQLTAEFEAANCRKLSFRIRAKMDRFDGMERYVYLTLQQLPIPIPYPLFSSSPVFGSQGGRD